MRSGRKMAEKEPLFESEIELGNPVLELIEMEGGENGRSGIGWPFILVD